MNNDAISRSAVLEMAFCAIKPTYDCPNVVSAVSVEDIENLPALDVAPVVHGHWIHCKGKSNLWYCSECGDKMIYNEKRRTYNIVKLPMAEKNKFCRNCGTRMDGDTE